VPSHEYIFATSAFLGRIPTTTRAGFVPHTERSDQAEVAAAYIDLAELQGKGALDGWRIDYRPGARGTMLGGESTVPDIAASPPH
jgi:hypothetical protein